MIDSKLRFNEAARPVLSPHATRTRLERMWEKMFDPESMGREELHPVETARFIAEQARKMRLAALKSGQLSMLWMIENLYYEAYALGSVKPSAQAKHKAPCTKHYLAE